MWIDEEGVKTGSTISATTAGCPPIPYATRTDPGYSCHEFFEFAMGAARNGDIDTVVFGAAWERYLVAEDAGARPRNAIFSTRDPSRATLTWNAPEADWIFVRSERRSDGLRRGGRKWIRLRSNPSRPPFSPNSMFPDRLDPSRAIRRVPY